MLDFDKAMYKAIGQKCSEAGASLQKTVDISRLVHEWTVGSGSRPVVEYEGHMFFPGKLWYVDVEYVFLPGVKGTPYALPDDYIMVWKCFVQEDPDFGENKNIYAVILDKYSVDAYDNTRFRIKSFFPMCLDAYWNSLEPCVTHVGAVDLNKANPVWEIEPI
jgi:hypothetical protein